MSFLDQKLFRGVNVDPRTTGFTFDFWDTLKGLNTDFAYVECYDGADMVAHPIQLLQYGLRGTKAGLVMGMYCRLNPRVSGKAQATAFINTLVKLMRPTGNFVHPWLGGQYRLINFFNLRPALLIDTTAPDAMVLKEARAWLEHVSEVMRSDEGRKQFILDRPMVAASTNYLMQNDLTALVEYPLWIIDHEAGAFDEAKSPRGWVPELWHRGTENIAGVSVGINEAVSLGRAKEEPIKLVPGGGKGKSRALPILFGMGIAGLAFYAWQKGRIGERASGVYRAIT